MTPIRRHILIMTPKRRHHIDDDAHVCHLVKSMTLEICYFFSTRTIVCDGAERVMHSYPLVNDDYEINDM